MKPLRTLLFLSFSFSFSFSFLSLSLTQAADWPTWRGPNSLATLPAAAGEFPVEWTADDIVWQTPLPGPGNSSPIISGDRLFLTQATDNGKTRSLLCFDRKSGKILWQKSIQFDGDEATHKTNPYCASTPLTDGNAVYIWQGSAGFFAYDFDGNELWKRDLGAYDHIWGNAASPVFVGNLIIQHCGPGLDARIFALDKKSGETVWETDLPEAKSKEAKQFKGSWATPLYIEATQQLVIGLPKALTGFDAKTGKEIWRCGGLSDLCYTDALLGDGVLFYGCGYGGPAIGMRLPAAGETGDLTESHRLWVEPKNQQRIGSGVIVGDHIFILNAPGAAQCIEAKTGKVVWVERVGRESWSSMLNIGGKLYVMDKNSDTHVLEPSTEFKVLAKNSLPKREHTNATHAFADGQIFIRTDENLYCIGQK